MKVGDVNMAGAAVSSFPVTVERPATADSGRKSNAETEPVVQSNAQIREMVAEMQRQIDSMNVSLSFSPYGKNKERMAVVVSDKETGEVIREIPPKEIQYLYTKMCEVAAYIFNRKV